MEVVMNVKEAMNQIVSRCSLWGYGEKIGGVEYLRGMTAADNSTREQRIASLAVRGLVKAGYLTIEGKTRAAVYSRGTCGVPRTRASKASQPGLVKTQAKRVRRAKPDVTPEHLDAVLAAIEAKSEGILASELYRLPCGKDIAKAAARALVTSGAVFVQGERVKTRYVLR
jgi:hypothetical protein